MAQMAAISGWRLVREQLVEPTIVVVARGALGASCDALRDL